MALDEPRVGGHLLQVAEDRVEPLDVPDLQHRTAALRQGDQTCGLSRVVGHRLLDEDVLSKAEQLLGEREVRRGRRDHAQRVARRRGLGHAGEGADAVLRRMRARCAGIDIEHADELREPRFRELRIDPGMLLAE